MWNLFCMNCKKRFLFPVHGLCPNCKSYFWIKQAKDKHDS